ncbi:MAG TPA: class I SAM-dependent methyltransferase [Verrucomicrobiae bacterium]|jgi:SAM-dependent methyltransferase|nr:class I SAM-dependent methyltransferase [Verrucomicrobiae bacterium]
MTQEMTRYYAERAAEYERVYLQPAWQGDLPVLRERVLETFPGRRVLEVACGTGYWTALLAQVARAVHGEDVNAETLALARARRYPVPVTLARADAYAPGAGGFDAGLAALWLSHVDLGRMDEFLAAFHSRLEPGAVVLMFDERGAPNRRAVMTRRDAAGNRYEKRRISAGREFEIVKNLFGGDTLVRHLAPHGTDLAFEELERFWIVRYRAR